jgi:TolB-like protein/tetratricopeptide (TPR) repeat protein
MEIFSLSNEGIVIPKKENMAGRLLPGREKIKSNVAYKWIGALLGVLILFIIFYYNRFGSGKRYTGKDKSIAVLPFQNISNDTLQSYFTDGITEEIITQLSKIADLKVISRTSVMPYKNTNKNLRQIAAELNVSSILEGSVRRDGNTVRVTAQLIDAGTDKHIWSENYDGNSTDIFAIQSKVAQEIAHEMNATLTAEESKRIGTKPTGNIAAYEEYLRAKQLPLPQAERLLKDALKKDSTFAPAWASLAYTYSKLRDLRPADGPFYLRKSLDAALTAIEYGPELSESHMILGDVLKTVTLNPALSTKELKKSISINPSNAEAYVFLAYALMELGEFQSSESNLVKAEQLAPQSAFVKFAWIRFYTYSRNPEKLFAITNNDVPAFGNRGQSLKAWAFFLKNNYDSMLIYANQQNDVVLRGIACTQAGKITVARNAIDSLKAASQTDNSFSIGILYAWLGENQKAIEYLNFAYRLYDYDLISIKVNKIFDPLRKEEGFNQLLQKMGMQQQ